MLSCVGYRDDEWLESACDRALSIDGGSMWI
jgi:hypothetical protein